MTWFDWSYVTSYYCPVVTACVPVLYFIKRLVNGDPVKFSPQFSLKENYTVSGKKDFWQFLAQIILTTRVTEKL